MKINRIFEIKNVEFGGHYGNIKILNRQNFDIQDDKLFDIRENTLYDVEYKGQKQDYGVYQTKNRNPVIQFITL